MIVLCVIIPLTEDPSSLFVPGIALVRNNTQVVKYTMQGVDYYRAEWAVDIVDSDNMNYTKKAATFTTS
ncbi:hypothetical protein Pelo_10526 [Pelomyxa schiedti]|nr:hypothetical protein Pelo_10526 [Pelomyxa schiedti]